MECGFVVFEPMWLDDPPVQSKLIEHKCSTDSHFICSGGSVKIIKDCILEDEVDNDANEMFN
mgnify:CR=1 FL=1